MSQLAVSDKANESIDCLVLSEHATDYAAAIAATGMPNLHLTVCSTTDAAAVTYKQQTVVLADPDLLAPIIADMRSVKWVQSTWAGVTPLIKTSRRDYVLTSIKDVFGPPMAEYVIGYLLAHELRVLQRRDAQQRKQWDSTVSGSLSGKHLCILGTGSIGGYIARVASEFGLRVSGVNRSGRAASGFEKVVSIDNWADVLDDVDYLVATLPQTDATNSLLNEASLARLPNHAYLINIGRGNVIDEQALINALQKKTLAGAVLDVFEAEPLPPASPLWDVKNLQITGHIAATSFPSLIVPIFVENIRRYRCQDSLQYEVNFDTGY